ncbi:MAG TPA: penicillin-binding protein 2 [Candidatus Limnocylindrales bacterium]|nr:penicillin-binding protein 2 [Candidatus Limnocylindrales bacterium]
MSVYLDDRPKPVRSLSRFLTFALIVVIALSGMTARLFYLQVVDGGRLATLATHNRTVLEALPAPRGVIYDRNGRALVTNVPTFVVKLRPSDLPLDQRQGVVDRLAALLGLPAADINATIDGNPGSAFDLVRIATDVTESTARLIAEAGADLPGVAVAVEARREYTDGPLTSQLLGYTGPVSGDQYLSLKASGYLPDDLIGKVGIEAQYEAQLRGVYGSQSVEQDPSGRKTQVLQTITQAQPGDSLTLTIDTKEQQRAQTALQWAMKTVGIKRGVVIVMNPQTSEILAMVSLPSYDNNQFARGISNADYAKLLNDPDKPLLNHATQAHYPPGSTYKLVAGTGALADKKITATTKVATRGFLTLGSTRFYDWNHRGFGACNIYCGFGHSSDTFFFQMAGKLGIDRLGYWAAQYGFGQKTGIDLPGEVPGIVPTNQWKQDALGSKIFPGETYQAGIGQGYDVVTPIQLINAYAALANGGTLHQPQIVRDIVGPDGTVVRPFSPKIVHKLNVPASVLRTMRNAARSTVTLRHTYNLVDLPIKVAGKSGTAEFGLKDSKGRLPFSSWFVGFVPKDARHGSFNGTDSQLMVLAFAYDSRTIGNVATEIVKYYLQLHFGIKKDYRLPNLLKRGNFYQSN